MRRISNVLTAIALVAATVVVPGCGRKVTVVNPDTSIHLSGRWNDNDSKAVSEEMVNKIMRADAWITNFRDRAGRVPIVRVAQVVNRSEEEIATGIFTTDLENALINSGRVRVVTSRSEAELSRAERTDIAANSAGDNVPKQQKELAPDFLLQGAIRIQHDSDSSQQVKFYQVDLYLADTTTNEKVWIGSTERKKVVER